jgi:hypothetical protein
VQPKWLPTPSSASSGGTSQACDQTPSPALPLLRQFPTTPPARKSWCDSTELRSGVPLLTRGRSKRNRTFSDGLLLLRLRSGRGLCPLRPSPQQWRHSDYGFVAVLRPAGLFVLSCTRPATASQRRDFDSPPGLRPLPLPWGNSPLADGVPFLAHGLLELVRLLPRPADHPHKH